jgi:acid phosphatase
LHNSEISPVGITENYTKRSWFHNVALLGLQPGTKYYYRILASPDHCVRESGIYSFKTAPVAGNPSPINITILSDLGNNNLINLGAATRTMKVLRAVAPVSDFYIHSGDITYADDYNLGLPLEFYEQSWNKWQGDMQALTANNVYMTACGNHEVTCFQLGDWACGVTNYRNFTPYLHRFRMPGDESGGYKNLWYSFDYGLVHVVVISTETDFPNASAGPGTLLNGGNFKGLNGQLDWFEADLIAANANRDQVPWILVTGHRRFYGSLPAIAGIPIPGLCDACLAAFEPYILQYNVDFYFSGHVH